MRNMSFSLTTQQILDRTKTVTRRKGWKFLKPGDLIQACEQCMGLKRGETINRLAVLRVRSVRREQLTDIILNPDDVTREGFPDMTPSEFIGMFMKHMGGGVLQTVTRIEFDYWQ